ncbi:MAG: nuclear transport factor 2 family protein [Actinobacteria bacterium]|nr:nuclear transport factor 2 family protein [Actinomycetota bacterium]
MSESNAELARRGYEAAARGDFEAIAALLAVDVRWHGGNPSDPAACHDRGEALAFMRQAAARDGIGELVDVVEVGQKVVVIICPPGRDLAEDGALAANLTTFADGKVVEMVHFPDPEAALAAARSAP